jgi:hypothetical protein
MVRVLRRPTLAALLFLAACAAEEPELEELPPPPPAPPRVQPRPAPAAQRVRPPEPEVPPTAAEAAVAAIAAPAATPAAPPAPAGWRVARDGTLGCAEAAPLRLLRNGGDAAPRVLAEARAAGGCRTTFRVNEWALDRSDADVVRLRLQNGPPLTLWFLRGDVVAP